MSNPKSIADTTGFLLGKLGELAVARFAERLAPLQLRPRLCGVLSVLSQSPGAQTTLATRLRVSPSVIVDMVDELEGLGAVRRIRDTEDRRRQLAELTEHGKKLAARSTALALETDAELTAELTAEERRLLATALRRLATVHGIRPASVPAEPTSPRTTTADRPARRGSRVARA